MNDTDATIYAVTDTNPFEHLTIRLSDIRVLRQITPSRSPSLAAMGWHELLYVEGLPARPRRALVDIDNLAIALGWFAGFGYNTPIADAYEDRPFHPERPTGTPAARPRRR